MADDIPLPPPRPSTLDASVPLPPPRPTDIGTTVPLPPARPANLDQGSGSGSGADNSTNNMRKMTPEDSIFELFAYIKGHYIDPEHLFYGSSAPASDAAEKKLKDILGATFPVLEGELRIAMNKLTNNPNLEKQTVAAMKFFGASPIFKVAMDQILPKKIAQFASAAHGGGAGAFNLATNTLFSGGAIDLQTIVGRMLGGSSFDTADPLSALAQATKSVATQVGALANMASGIATKLDMSRPEELIGLMSTASKVFGGTDQALFSNDVFAAGAKMSQAVQKYLAAADQDPNGFLGSIDHIGDITNALSIVGSLGYQNTVAALFTLPQNTLMRIDPQGYLTGINPARVALNDAKNVISLIGSGQVLNALQEVSSDVRAILDPRGTLNLFDPTTLVSDLQGGILSGFDFTPPALTAIGSDFQSIAGSLSGLAGAANQVGSLLQNPAGALMGIMGPNGPAGVLNSLGNLANQAGQLVNKAGDIIDQIDKLHVNTAMNPAKLLSQIETAQQVGRLF